MSKKFVPLQIHGTGRYSDEYISFEAEPRELLNDYNRYEAYVKGCETAVRYDDRYTAYIAKLKEGGLTRCAIMGRLPETNTKLKTEMHHGPIFSLFDICDIVLKDCLKYQKRTDITTFKIADLVLTEHELDHIMIVMLSKTVHMGGAHNKKSNRGIFVDITATFGRIDEFISKYYHGLEPEHFQYIERYVEECKNAQGNSLDQGLFDTADRLESFK